MLLPEVLWRRRWTVVATVCTCLAAAGVYLACAPRVYVATARVLVEPSDPKVFGDGAVTTPRSEDFLQTQVDVFGSGPVLARAVAAGRYRTLPGDAGDAAAALRRALKVDAAKKSDVVVVSVESTVPAEAVAQADAVVAAYLAELSDQRRAAGDGVLAALRRESDDLGRKRDAVVASMLKHRQDRGVYSFHADKGNLVLDRATSLSGSLTTASVTSMELRGQLEATRAAMADPASLTAFVHSLQQRGRDWADREYEELRAQLTQQSLAQWGSEAFQGASHPRAESLRAVVAALRRQIAAKERSIAEAQLAAVSTQLAAAEAKERQLAATVGGEQKQVAGLIPDAVAYERLEATAAELQKQAELVNDRMLQVAAGSAAAAPLNARVLESARAAENPVRPRPTLVLAAAALAGCALGIGLAMLRDRRDVRVRSAEEVPALLGTAVVAGVPVMNPRLSPVARGQIVHLDPRSPAAEAYRSARTALNLGSGRDARTVLVASPATGDGKSTTASNLAIAFAQAGQRTLILDCDLRQPVQHLIFEADGEVGVTSVVAGEASLRDAVRRTRVPGLYLLPCGPVPLNPSELLSGDRFAGVMRALARSFDRIVIDSSPLAAVADAQTLAAEADATLMVVRVDESDRDLAVRARDGLERAGADVLGVIVNGSASAGAYDGLEVGGGRGGHRTTWQYATSAQRLLATARTGADDAPGLSPRAAAALATTAASDPLDIEEPDWAAGHGSNGHGPNGHGPNGHGANGHGTAGRRAADREANGHDITVAGRSVGRRA